MKIINGKDEDFSKNVLQNPNKVLVDFWAPWCGPCKMIAPLLEQMSKEDLNLQIVKINIDENPQIATQHNIRSIPTLMLFNNGKLEQEHKGSLSYEQLKKLVS